MSKVMITTEKLFGDRLHTVYVEELDGNIVVRELPLSTINSIEATVKANGDPDPTETLILWVHNGLVTPQIDDKDKLADMPLLVLKAIGEAIIKANGMSPTAGAGDSKEMFHGDGGPIAEPGEDAVGSADDSSA